MRTYLGTNGKEATVARLSPQGRKIVSNEVKEVTGPDNTGLILIFISSVLSIVLVI